MDSVTLVFLIIGCVGVGLLLLSLVVGDLLEFADADADGPFSLPAIAAYVGGVGFFGMIGASIFDFLSRGPQITLAVLTGLILALPLGYGAVRLARGLSRMRTDRTLTEADLVGALGVVITSIPVNGFGEVRVHLGGTDLKYSARAEQPLPAGTGILVVNSLSATAVEVISTSD